ncbi:MAG: hypothetical protein HKN04_03725 [Rhodothermaceae bacterium]|nr:hypothetical protein [Rhodothermaceae bacterium]
MRLLLLPLFLLLLLSTGCKGSEGAADEGTDPATILEVENRNFNDMNIFVLRGGQRLRLGSVTGGGTREFVLPPYLVNSGGALRFLADPVGGTQTPVTQEMSVFPGDVVRLTIPSF